MKLNHECVRDMLLVLENTGFGGAYTLEELMPKLPKYNYNELWYTALKLYEAGFITADMAKLSHTDMLKPERITDITYNGHEFLNTIREDTMWEKVKDIAAKVGSTSVRTLAEIASTIVTILIQKHLG